MIYFNEGLLKGV